jgi:hypothetical protein
VFKRAYQSYWKRKPSIKTYTTLSGIDLCIDLGGYFHISDDGPYCNLVDAGYFRVREIRIPGRT